MPTVAIYHLGRPHVSLRPKDKSHHLISTNKSRTKTRKIPQDQQTPRLPAIMLLPTHLIHELTIKSLLIRERYYRDSAQWDKLRQSWHPDANTTSLKISWYVCLSRHLHPAPAIPSS